MTKLVQIIVLCVIILSMPLYANKIILRDVSGPYKKIVLKLRNVVLQDRNKNEIARFMQCYATFMQTRTRVVWLFHYILTTYEWYPDDRKQFFALYLLDKNEGIILKYPFYITMDCFYSSNKDFVVHKFTLPPKYTIGDIISFKILPFTGKWNTCSKKKIIDVPPKYKIKI